MKTTVTAEFLAATEGREAAAILRRCVHCGFCNSACPTYLQLGDEKNGPRGRIYQIKNFMEGQGANAANLANLDLCLTCQACESACPSGVEYLRLLDFARPQIAAAVGRSATVRRQRRLALAILLRPRLLKILLTLAAVLRPALPARYRAYLPQAKTAPPVVATAAARRVLLYDGCVQGVLRPAINAHARAILSAVGIAAEEARPLCCGALQLHLEDNTAPQRIRANVDFFHAKLQSGVSRIVSTASGCGRTIAEYGRLLAHDRHYAGKAAQVSAAHCDVAELLAATDDLSALTADSAAVAFHCPCTLQHGQNAAAAVPGVLTRLGAQIRLPDDSGCCGSAGFYSQEHPGMARRLRDSRLNALNKTAADSIITANIGCQLHLQSGSQQPVRHWLQTIKIKSGTVT